MSNTEIKPAWRRIHQALHDRRYNHVYIQRVSYDIQIHPVNGVRFLDYDNIRFVEQNRAFSSELARRARRGERITWCNPHDGSPAFVIDQTVLLSPVFNATLALPLGATIKKKEATNGDTSVAAGNEEPAAKRGG